MQKYPEIEPKIRFSRIQQMMEERGLDAMIFYSTQWKLEIIHYVANLRLLGEDACVVLPKGGEPILLLSQPWDLERARAQSWIQEIEVCPGTALLERAGKLARSMGEHIGVAGIEFMTAAKYADLQRELSGKTVTNEYSGLDEVADVYKRQYPMQ